MRALDPFQADDLEELHTELFSRADRVVPMRDIYKGDTDANVIGLRHDVDDNMGSFWAALEMAKWEFEHGYSSTYYLLHGAHYWGAEMFEQVPQFEELGHEVGLHVNALAEALRIRQDPHAILAQALSELRACGVRVVGCVAHGDHLCHVAEPPFVNDELFTESRRESYGSADRMITANRVAVHIVPMSRRAYQLEYDANWLRRGDYVSDSGGEWSQPFEQVCAAWPERGQLHMLIHPDWWVEAFAPEVVPA
jgi:hypothetical protein